MTDDFTERPPAPSHAKRPVVVLPPEVADKIAAGEVVERPASVVKELVENSLDAGATTIRIEMEDAGVGLISVIDDGAGMSREDAVLAFRRHATSKVREIDDLFRIATYGFRGEALASIAAVSTTTLITRPAADLEGTEVLVRGGILADVRAAGCPAGTRVDVVDLFGNTPARRKFLKAPATEVGHVSELVTRTALACPGVTFSLRHGRRTLLEFPATDQARERVAQVFGRDRAASMLSFRGRTPAGEIHGWLTGSHVSLPSARQIYTYVNQRYVRDRLVSHALVAGYSTLLMHGRYPAAVVFLDVPPEDVDVNVHPAKSEVRFRRGGAVHELITRAVSERLRTQPPPQTEGAVVPVGGESGSLPEEGASARLPLPAWRPAGAVVPLGSVTPFSRAGREVFPGPTWLAGAPSSAPGELVPPGESGEAASGATMPEPAGEGFFARLRILGQAFEGYLVGEAGAALLIIDQHAAHERVMFERLRNAFAAGGVQRQQLLLPVTVEVGPQAEAQVAEHLAEFEALGFELEPFGGGTLAVRAVPALLADHDPISLVRDLADEFADVGGTRVVAAAAESVLARLACHSAVRVGQSLSGEQIQALLRSMDAVDFSTNCPHGRPAYITLPRSDLERLFRRV